MLSSAFGKQKTALIVVAAILAMLAMTLVTPRTAFAVGSPDGCNADNSVVNIARSSATAAIGDPITFTVSAGNPASADGCDITGRTLTLTLPDGSVYNYGPFNYPNPSAVAFVEDEVYVANAAHLVGNTWTATVSWNGTLQDGFSSPSTGQKQTSVNAQFPDVKVTKTADNSPINAGDVASYTIEVENLGPGTATGVTLSDTLVGTGWSENSASCTITPAANDALNCTFGDMVQGATASVTVSKTTTTAQCGTLPNTATVAATNEDQTKLDNNTDDASIVVNCPDVSVLKTADNSPINAGDVAAFLITVTGNGPGTATGVTLTDNLPGTGWSEDSASCTITPGANDTLNCDIGTLANGATFQVTVSKTTTHAQCGTLPNTATVTATGDTNSQNNSSSASIVVNCPDVSVLKTADNSPINAGDVAAFLITVTGNGPGTATGVTLTDNLPGTGWSENSASCTITPGANDTLNCDIGTLANGATFQVTVSKTTAVDGCGVIENTATVTALGDTNPNNNSSTASITVVCDDFAGCTPGFWRQSQHFQYWIGYTPGQSFEAVFDVDVTLRGTGKTTYANPTMLQAVEANGGDVNALARHAVAALLNAVSGEVDYKYTEAEIKAMVKAAIDSGNATQINNVHNTLAEQNELGCTVDKSKKSGQA